MTDDEDLLDLSIPEEDPPHPLKEALGTGDPDLVTEFLAAGADIRRCRLANSWDSADSHSQRID
jgi:hypothetical protein